MKIQTKKIGKSKNIFTFFCILLTALCVYLAIECATSGSEIAKLIDTQEKLTKEKKELTSKLVEVSSLNVIQEKATPLGFSEPKKVVYIQKTDEFASLLR